MIELETRAIIGNMMLDAFEDYLICIRKINSKKHTVETIQGLSRNVTQLSLTATKPCFLSTY